MVDLECRHIQAVQYGRHASHLAANCAEAKSCRGFLCYRRRQRKAQ